MLAAAVRVAERRAALVRAQKPTKMSRCRQSRPAEAVADALIDIARLQRMASVVEVELVDGERWTELVDGAALQAEAEAATVAEVAVPLDEPVFFALQIIFSSLNGPKIGVHL